MKKFLYITTILLSISVIVFGHLHWKSKISTASVSANDDITEDSDANVNESEVEETESKRNLETLTQNLPKEAASIIIDSFNKGEQLDLAFIGSEAQTKGSTPWPELVEEGLKEAYGPELFTVHNYNFGDEFSIRAIRTDDMDSIINDQPDIVILEPFLLNDNGEVNINHTIDSIRIIKRRMVEENEEVIFMVQPPHPIHEPGLYATQINALKEYAEETDTTYLNHWDNWPDVTDEEIKQYILEDISGPNDEGNKLWAEYIVNYFTGS
ncbi:SGNH/GDSL hydrolase family protein [Pseudalkalibacillus berkeleyi]|uniref:SGNH/GDSL hydrolase family protein n=1 Tax=Pseudalkalibacillus berkeleyi TaxID=1069813 RepID=A0ABS9H4T9_9BACL|nr:SGNH/GDSL hydrolase family protein [Pseudalkalibacillus berkeleyi]MCF6138803.1 SGNH/GDSL hydrolase family protein [Pseudalkalibacillus berkeleyi]